jgi:hypothetical protein
VVRVDPSWSGDVHRAGPFPAYNTSRMSSSLTPFSRVIVTIPVDNAVDPDGKVDWIGIYFRVAGLILFNFV